MLDWASLPTATHMTTRPPCFVQERLSVSLPLPFARLVAKGGSYINSERDARREAGLILIRLGERGRPRVFPGGRLAPWSRTALHTVGCVQPGLGAAFGRFGQSLSAA